MEVPLHVMEALEDDLDEEREEVPCPVVDPSGAARIPVRNRFSVLESTVRDTECLMSTVVDGSSGDMEVFTMTDDAAGHVPREPRLQPDRRRLVLIPQVQDTPPSIQDRSEGEVAAVPPLVDHGVSGGESDRPLLDTESLSSQGFSTDIDGQSEVSGADEAESEVEPDPPFRMPGVATLRAAFLLLDQVNLAVEMEERANVMKSVPKFLRGPYRIAMRTALEEICGGRRSQEGVRQERGWKLFFCTGRQEGASFHDRNWRAGLSRS